MIQETKPSVYSADPTLTIFVFDVLTIGGAKLSSGISCGLFLVPTGAQGVKMLSECLKSLKGA